MIYNGLLQLIIFLHEITQFLTNVCYSLLTDSNI